MFWKSLFFAVSLVAVRACNAQSCEAWIPDNPTPHNLCGSTGCYDEARDGTLMVQATPTYGYPAGVIWGAWLFTNEGWTRVAVPDFGIASGSPSMIYDSVARRSRFFLDQTEWSWNGIAWIRKFMNGVVPSGLYQAKLAFDPNRNAIVAGIMSGNVMNIWEYDGDNWSNRGAAPSTNPLVYSPADGLIITPNTVTHSTWGWNGESWTQLTSGDRPMTPISIVCTPANGKVYSVGNHAETYIWERPLWRFITDNYDESLRSVGYAVACPGGSGLSLLGSNRLDFSVPWHNPDYDIDARWVLAGTNWERQDIVLPTGYSNFRSSLAFDESRSRFIFCGGGQYNVGQVNVDFGNVTPDTVGTFNLGRGLLYVPDINAVASLGLFYSWNGISVNPFAPPAPPEIFSQQVESVALRGHGKVLVCGRSGSWIYDLNLNLWRAVPAQPSGAPRSDQGHLMVFDEFRDTAILFGGYSQQESRYLNETWEFNPISEVWTRRTGPSPTARMPAGFVYDSVSHDSILIGGEVDGMQNYQCDRWRWNGSDWSQLSSPVLPAAWGTSMAMDRALNEVVAFVPTAGIYRLTADGLVVRAISSDLSVNVGERIELSVGVESGNPITFKWFKNSVELINSSRVSGADTAVLEIADAAATDSDEYLVRISNECGNKEFSFSVVVNDCVSDFNHDGGTDFFDYLDFVDAYSIGLPSADFNQDMSIDFFDYLDFVDAYSIGC